MRMNKRAALWMAIILPVIVSSVIFGGSIKTSKHNLSSGSPVGEIKAGDTSMICIFCHTSHSGRSFAPMWNRESGVPVYTLYDSSTLYSRPGQPDGTSKLCLSCHDGTIALGRVLSRKNEFAMLNTSMGRIPPGKRSNLGSDLSDDHPISFDPAAAVSSSSELKHPAPYDAVAYDAQGKLQCTSCHDPHNDSHGDFLARSNVNAAICKTCHEPVGFSGLSTHDLSSATWNGHGQNPWPNTRFQTVSENSCLNCHSSHGAGGKERLLTDDREEEVCFVCHNGSVAANVRSDFLKISSHDVRGYRGIHDPTENIGTSPRHVECIDCHNAHSLNGQEASAPYVKGVLKNVSGTAITGGQVDNAAYEYEVCIKCHGEDRYYIQPPSQRLFNETTNLRTAFQPTNASYHPVAAQGKNTTGNLTLMPRFIPGASRIYCSSCHNSDSSRGAGGVGPNGPHGSSYEYILERQYVTADYTRFSTGNYALCFKCHYSSRFLDENGSGFKYHRKHTDEEGTPCSVCHDPHGSPNYVGLLNFDTNVVFPNSNGELKFEIIGNTGYCYMECHGKEHKPKEYTRR
jgi:predicted CXXCH cytochrome family protein